LTPELWTSCGCWKWRSHPTAQCPSRCCY